MALTIQPSRFPDMGPIRSAVIDAVQLNLVPALALVNAKHVDTLPDGYPRPPVAYGEAALTDFTLVNQWPSFVVVSGTLTTAEAYEQLGASIWEAELMLRYYEQYADPTILTRLLDRYAAAMWVVMIDASETHQLAGAEMLYGSEDIQPNIAGGGGTQRAVEFSFNVRMRV